ncbi:MAG: hypothetical protein IT260_23205 [Saprospiraceae bacterium]|nr:hypothetical protein [Saprospiraceae bacterium]
MTVEGSFGAVSPANDKAASLGIFQWATTKNAAVTKDSSLNKFLVDLHDRSAAAKTNTGLDKVYKDAWKALSDKGLSVKNGLVQLNSKTPTGQELEDSLHGTMGSNTSLKAYQILRSGEQIDHLLDITVAPGPLGSVFSDKLGATLDSSSGGAFTLKSSKTNTHKITFKKPGTAAAIRDTVSSMRAKTYIYNLYTNRPAYASMAVWRAFRGGDYSSQVQTAMDTLIASWTLHETTTKVKKKATQFSEDQVRALNDPTANAALDQIKAILWVNKSTESLAEETLLENFVKEGLEIYARRDAKTDSYVKGRPARLASTETGDW